MKLKSPSDHAFFALSIDLRALVASTLGTLRLKKRVLQGQQKKCVKHGKSSLSQCFFHYVLNIFRSSSLTIYLQMLCSCNLHILA